MPAIRTGQEASAPKIILKYGERKIVMPCPATYEAALAAARADFAIIQGRQLTLHVDMAYLEPGSREGLVEITSRAWTLLAGCASTPVLEVRAPACAAEVALPAGQLSVRFCGAPAGTLTFNVKPTSRIARLLQGFFQASGLHAHEWRVMVGQDDLANFSFMTVGEFGFRNDDAVQCVPRDASG